MPVLSKRIVLDCFYLLIFYFEKFSTDVCRLPCAVNVNLNLSIDNVSYTLAFAFFIIIMVVLICRLGRFACFGDFVLVITAISLILMVLFCCFGF